MEDGDVIDPPRVFNTKRGNGKAKAQPIKPPRRCSACGVLAHHDRRNCPVPRRELENKDNKA